MRSAAERQKICTPWREPWDQGIRFGEPRRGETCLGARRLGFAALRLIHLVMTLPTAGAVGYRYFAALRLAPCSNVSHSFRMLTINLILSPLVGSYLAPLRAPQTRFRRHNSKRQP